MPYCLKPTERLQSGVRRIAREQLRIAEKSPPDDAARVLWVHESRKSIKRVRALLRLVRNGLEPKVWHARNTALRDVGRSLSALRDHDILRPILARLLEVHDRDLDQPAAWFLARIDQVADSRDDPKRTPAAIVKAAQKSLAGIAKLLADLHLKGDASELLGAGLARSYHPGADLLAIALADPVPDRLHDLRKCVQLHQRQMSLLTPAWPEMLEVRVAAARKLAELLGESQDLSVLIARTDRLSHGNKRPRDAERLIDAALRRQAGIREQAVPAAKRLFAVPSQALGAEVITIWRTAVDEADSAT